MNLAFWNIGNLENPNVVSDLIADRALAIIALAEASFTPSDLQKVHLSRHNTVLTSLTPSSPRIQFYTLFNSDLFRPVADSPYLSIKEFLPPIGESILLAACHLRSKLQSTDLDQNERAIEICSEIAAAEAKAGHRRSLLFGDFNMNPFETGVIGARSFNAVMDRRIAEKGSRTFDREERHYFYNPMWHLMGNRENNAKGTYFFKQSVAHNYHWNTYDQVIVRPGLLDIFDESSLAIVESIGSLSLLATTGDSIDESVSDHLPIVFNLKS